MKVAFFVSINVLFLLMVTMSCSGDRNMSEEEYFNLAKDYMDQQNWVEAEAYFEKISSKYGGGKYAAQATFMVGYINANELKNFEKAREYYNLFLERYPNDDLATAAKYELENMGKSPDELPFLNEEPPADQSSGAKEMQAANKKE